MYIVRDKLMSCNQWKLKHGLNLLGYQVGEIR